MAWNEHWSDTLQETTYKMLKAPTFMACRVKHSGGDYGSVMRYIAEEGSYIVMLSDKEEQAIFDSLDALLTAGWVVD
jgi:hypothetical protein